MNVHQIIASIWESHFTHARGPLDPWLSGLQFMTSSIVAMVIGYRSGSIGIGPPYGHNHNSCG